MNRIELVTIDLPKRCYQVGAIDEHGKVLYNHKHAKRQLSEGRIRSSDVRGNADRYVASASSRRFVKPPLTGRDVK